MNHKAPPLRRTQAERTDEARTALIDAAIALIAERGLAGVTLSDVGAKAGYSRGLAVYHFGSKSGLILAVFDHVRDLGGQTMQRFAKPAASGVERLLSLFDAIADSAAGAPLLYRATTALLIDGAMSPEAEIRSRTQVAETQALTVLTGLVDSADLPGTVDRAALARLMLNAIYGVQMRAFLMGDQLDVRAEMQGLRAQTALLLQTPKG
jgi:AcrR family transcriptional regulator